MADVELAHTAQLDAATLGAIRAMLDIAYEGEFADEDWDHTLGGMHALVREGDDVIAHGSVVARSFLHLPAGSDDWAASRPLRAAYVEGVAVRADRRRRGLGAAVMASLRDVIKRAYDLGALSSSDDGMSLYQAQGWLPWGGETFVMAASGIKRTAAEDEGIYVLPVRALALGGRLACDWRSGDVW